jgi:Tol biopolymer transport system component
LLTALGSLGIAPAGLLAQATEQEVPKIEVAYTQILSADSLTIGQAALSPDGRWVVFTDNATEEESHLWMVSSEGGGPFPITSGPAYDDGPVWFPPGNRIAYRSGDRIVSLAIDRATGKPVGNPKRVTLESSNAYFDISPDGKWIAYTPRDENRQRVIRVVPSNGGIARTVAEESTNRPTWAPDGKSIYYRTSRLDSPLHILMKIRVEGGVRAEGATPDTVLISSQFVMHIPSTVFLALGRSGVETGLDLAALDGRRLAWLELEDGMNPRVLSKDARWLLATRGERASPLRVLPVAGGTAITLQQTDSRALAWTPDGDRVLLETNLDGEKLLFLAAVSGGTMTQVRFPEEPADFGRPAVDFPLEHQPDPVLSADGRHLLYAVAGTAPDTAILMILDLESGRASVLTTRYPTPRWDMSARVSGAGDEFFYWEKEEGALVLKAANPLGGSRVLRAFDDPNETVSVSVFQDRLAYVENVDGRASIILAEVGSEQSRRILTVDGFLDVLAWSPDGHWLAATHWPGDGSGAKPMLVEVSASGEVEGEPRLVGPGAWSWWGHQWLPDSSGFLTAGTQGDVWLIPVDPAAEPVALTEQEEGEIFNFVLSPDGRQIACAPHIPQGSSLWLIDLGDALVKEAPR